MTTTVTVRPIEDAEHEQLADLTVAAYRAVLGPRLHPDYVPTLRAVGERARTDTVLVAVGDDGLLGGVAYIGDPESPNAEFPTAADAGIRYLAVAPEAQGHGVATQLVRACMDLARAEGKARIVLHTQPEMTTAQRLYVRLGFVRAPAYDWSPVPGVNLVAFAGDC